MAVKTTWEENGVHWQLTGVVPFQQILNTIEGFYNDVRSDRAKYQLINASKLDAFEVTERDMKCVAAFDYGASKTIKNLKVACVANNPENKKVFELYIEGSRNLNSSWKFQIFDNLETAREWVES